MDNPTLPELVAKLLDTLSHRPQAGYDAKKLQVAMERNALAEQIRDLEAGKQ